MNEKEHIGKSKDEPSNEDIQDIKNLISSKKSPNAEIKIKNLASKYPKSYNLLNLLGVSLILQNKLDEAEKIYLKLIELKKNFAEAHNNLGQIYLKQIKIEKAILYFEKAIKIAPDLEQPHYNLAKIYTDLGNNLQIDGKIQESVKKYEQAIKNKADFAEAHNNLGIALQNLNKFDEAILSFKKAIEIKPDFEEAFNNVAASFVLQGRFEDAISFYNKTLKLNPNKTQYAINANLLIPTIPKSNEDLKSWRKKFDLSIDSLEKNKYSIDDPQKVINPPTFNLSYCNINNLNIMKKVSDFFRKSIPVINFQNNRINSNYASNKTKRLRIGFISEFFTDHTIGKLYKGLLKAIDKKKFELILFHFQKTKHGKIKEEIEKSADKIIYLSGKITTQQNLIEKEFLDIIFYPDIGMTASTYFLAHARLAPIQIMSWGHPETSGISTIDYFLSSTLMESEGTNTFYSERLICLDSIFLNFIPPRSPEKNLIRSDFNFSQNINLYCCPQTLFKIHPDFDEVLYKIIEKDPDAEIIMIETKHKIYVDKLKKRWSENFPLLNKKIKFVKNMSLNKFLSLIKVSDVLLDPLYFGGGLSFAESMVIGTPTITMPNKFMRSNITAGAYKQMKIKEPPIVKSVNEYVDLANDLANDKKKNFELRHVYKEAAKLHLFNDLDSVKKFERFLIEAHKANNSNTHLKDGYIIS